MHVNIHILRDFIGGVFRSHAKPSITLYCYSFGVPEVFKDIENSIVFYHLGMQNESMHAVHTF